MREIKFRGLNRRNDRRWSGWHYGDLWVERSGVCVGSYEVDPDTVGQFTGLHDCEGREIYEGDIIKVYRGCYERDGIHTDFIFHAVVCWVKNGFMYKGPGIFGSTFDNVKVIGNVHDNPQLLGGSHDQSV